MVYKTMVGEVLRSLIFVTLSFFSKCLTVVMINFMLLYAFSVSLYKNRELKDLTLPYML